MSHFYRIVTKNDAREKPEIRYVGSVYDSGEEGKRLSAWDYEEVFEKMPTEKKMDGLKMYQAPVIDEEKLRDHAIYDLAEGIGFPDVIANGDFPIVSAKVKKVIESVDAEFEHQFCEIKILNENKTQINFQPYYRLNVRRHAEVEYGPGRMKSRPFYPGSDREEDYLAAIQNNDGIKAYLATLPLWKHKENRSALYFNEVMFAALKEAGVTGLTMYSDKFGGPREAVARFE